jgi:hypothetical protein
MYYQRCQFNAKIFEAATVPSMTRSMLALMGGSLLVLGSLAVKFGAK